MITYSKFALNLEDLIIFVAMRFIKKAFTLVELTITMIIISLLIGIVFQVFIVISHIAVKIQNEKLLHNELIYVMQTIQNIVDEGNVELV